MQKLWFFLTIFAAYFCHINSQLISGGTWSWPAAASSARAVRSTRARSCRRTRSCTVPTASGACRVRSHRSVLRWRSVGLFARLCTRGGTALFILLFWITQPQTLQLDFLMKILPNYHHLKKTVKGNGTPVRNWRGSRGVKAPAGPSTSARRHLKRFTSCMLIVSYLSGHPHPAIEDMNFFCTFAFISILWSGKCIMPIYVNVSHVYL